MLEILQELLGKLTEVEIIRLLLTAEVANVITLLAGLILLAAIVSKIITKPEEERNEILRELASGIRQTIEIQSTTDRLNDDRDEKYVGMILQNRGVTEGISEKINRVIELLAVIEKTNAERDSKYVNMIERNTNITETGVEIIRNEVRSVNDVLVAHNASRCREHTTSKVVTINARED